jgi:TPR repeat protein
MTGVFLSYSRADRALAEQVVAGLRRIGVGVWWDQDMPGVDWQDELASEIEAMVGVVVLWTPSSVASKNVKDEARLAQHKEKLVNVLAGVKSPPFPFDRVNGLPLDGWNGIDPHGGWSRLVRTIEGLAVLAGATQPGAMTEALTLSERQLRAKRQVQARAQEAFQDAQSLEAEAEDAAKAAKTALEMADSQLRRVMEMGATPLLRRAAQQEFDEAVAAKEATGHALRAAKVQLSAASRQHAEARAELAEEFGPSAEAFFESATVGQAGAMMDIDGGSAGAEATSIDSAPPVAPPAASPQPEAVVPPIPSAAAPPASQAPPVVTPPSAAPATTASGPAPILLWLGGIALAIVIVLVVAVAQKPKSDAGNTTSANVATNDVVAANDNAAPAQSNAAPVEPMTLDDQRLAGEAAFDASNYARALPLLRGPAQAGNAKDQNLVGFMYYNGWAVPKDYNQAMTWYQLAAAQNNADAQSNIGVLYENGYGVPKDQTQAMNWFQKAAAQGNPAAQDNIGFQYDQGWGVTQDYGEAMSWYKKAAANGNITALADIGRLYQFGYGVRLDLSKARDWYAKAAARGSETAKAWLLANPK